MRNLDELSYASLIKTARNIYNNKERMAKKFFPDKPEGYEKTIGRIQTYCWFRALSISRRDEGQEEKALELETELSSIYNDLPDYAHWR